MARLRLQDVRKSFGSTHVVRGVSLDVADGEFLVIVGPSGCGKSTLLRMLAGLETPTAGEIWIGERRVDDLPPGDRDLAMVFQSYALYPHMTVRDNISFGLRVRKTAPDEIARRVGEAAALLGLEPLLDRFPRQLSGGQRQRVAMGRAIVRRPSAFLFDEPLSNLDAALRNQVRVELRRLHAKLRATILYVTHDQIEAMTLADRIVLLHAGVVQQIGTPEALYRWPANRFVASFLGTPPMNFLLSRAGEADLRSSTATWRFDPDRLARPLSGDVVVGVRPHDLHRTGDPARDSVIDATVDLLEPMGWETQVHLCAGEDRLVLRSDAPGARDLQPGAALRLFVRAEDARLFDPASGEALLDGPAG